MANIEDLLSQSEEHSKQPDSRVPHANLEITSDEKKAELESKMGEIKRRDLELEILSQARNSGLGYVSFEGITIDPEILRLIPEPEAKHKKVISFFYVPYQQLRIATPIPDSPAVKKLVEDLGKDHHTPAKIYQISEASFQDALAQYARLPKIKHISQTVDLTTQELDKFETIDSFKDFKKMAENVNTTELINLIVAGALKFNASDIHVESEQEKLVLRYRIDGVLHEITTFKPEVYRAISSRIKLLSKLKINVTKEPQDGHFVITRAKGNIDVRVSTLPTNYGESIVMRVLRGDLGMLNLTSLGLSEYNFNILSKEIQRPNGMLVVCGPTGSGKTTSLYAILGELKSEENKILTIEDPIEYQIEGLSQSQVNNEKGYTFAAGLRSLVRQDPDVILVGEMRDTETVEISINAALTGHYVLSTMHTNDAAGAIPRFLSMDAKPYLLAPALNTVVSQRLVRVIKPECKKETTLSPEVQERINELVATLPEEVRKTIPENPTFYSADGCDDDEIGYKGRTGIFEIFTVSPELEKMILAGELSSIEIKKVLAAQGMISMAQDGILKAIQGITTVDEVFRVVDEERD